MIKFNYKRFFKGVFWGFVYYSFIVLEFTAKFVHRAIQLVK